MNTLMQKCKQGLVITALSFMLMSHAQADEQQSELLTQVSHSLQQQTQQLFANEIKQVQFDTQHMLFVHNQAALKTQTLAQATNMMSAQTQQLLASEYQQNDMEMALNRALFNAQLAQQIAANIESTLLGANVELAAAVK